MKNICLVLLLLLASAGASASALVAQPLQFQTAAEEQRFHALTEQLRCVMCQNQSLADSNAMIAQDLRAEILKLMRAGRSDEQIKAYLVARYSRFVLYRPQVEPLTWLLWFGPALLVICGGMAIAVIVRRHSRGAPDSAVPPIDEDW